MFSKKQLLLNVAVLAIAIAAGAGSLWYAQADTCSDPQTYYYDADGDGYGIASSSVISCSQPAGYVTNSTDCNDAIADIHPGASEVCDLIDNNCSGANNEGLATTTYYRDVDGDTYGTSTETTVWCALPAGYASQNSDCLDTNANVNPGEIELCNSVDDDCDGNVDESCVNGKWYYDGDGDGYGNPNSSTTSDTQPSGYVASKTDCNDGNAAIHPGVTEICNGVDDDCDGSIDEGVKTTYYYDYDNDGYGRSASSTQACSAPDKYVTVNNDCNDSSSTIHPNAEELCNGIDDDCDGTYDEGCSALNTYYRDIDGDGYGNVNVTIQANSVPSGYASNDDDCNDSNSAINPGQNELCNSIDDDCDGTVDESCSTTTWYRDADSDGYGNPSISTTATSKPSGYVSDKTDCNDSNASVHPGATELDNNIDDDCDGTVDEGYNGDGNCDYNCNCKCSCTCTEPAGSFLNHGSWVSAWAHYTNCLKWKGEITGQEKGQMMKIKAQIKIEDANSQIKEKCNKNKGKNKDCDD
jgi:hypothetical protein